MTTGRGRAGELLRAVVRRTGLSLPASRGAAAERAALRALADTGAADPARILSLPDHAAAADRLLEAVTVGETYFFRDPDQLDLIRRRVLPPLVGKGRPVRVWSAGCATGEEAYSLAILLREAGVRGGRVLGTDVARSRLARARRGSYTRWSLRGVPDAVVERYFRREGDRFELSPFVRGSVEFRHHNLLESSMHPDPFTNSHSGGFDLVLCRNVLIYLDRDAVDAVAARLIGSLDERGWLFLGASDPLLSERVPCEVVVTEAGLAYRRPARDARSGGGAVESASPAHSTEPVGRTGPGPVLSPGGGTTSGPKAPAAGSPAPGARRRLTARPRGASEPAPGDAAAWADRVRSLADRGRLAEAGRACATALDRHRDSAELCYLHAVLLAAAGRHAESAGAARRALYLDRTLAVAHLALGVALTRVGDVDGAGRALAAAEQLLASEPADSVPVASGGATAGQLLALVRVKLGLLRDGHR